MNFPTFFNLLFPYIGNNMGEAKFARTLFENIVDLEYFENDPITEYDDSTFKHYVKGRRDIRKISKIIYEHLLLGKFAKYINNFDDAAHEAICDAIKPYYSKIHRLNVSDVCAEIFQGIIKTAAQSSARKKGREKAQQINASDISLLCETDFECPRCKKNLIQNIKGKQLKKYTVINLEQMTEQNESINTTKEIALCDDCANLFLIGSGDDERSKLKQLKEIVLKNQKINQQIDSQELIDGIDKILLALATNYSVERKIVLTKKALKIAKKISNNDILVSRIENEVKYYFDKVAELINQNENVGILSMNKLTCCIGGCYENLEAQKLSQQEIFDKMVDWLDEKTGVKNKAICSILISFFVQSCQVFHEITK